MKDENYYFVFFVHLKNEALYYSGCHAEARSTVYLKIQSETLTPSEITFRIGIVPTRENSKGEARKRSDGKSLGGVWKRHSWTYDPLAEVICTHQEKVERFLEMLEPAAAQIRALKPQCTLVLQTSYQGFSGQMWSISMSVSTLERLAALGADLDVDLYVGGPESPD